MKLYSAWYCPFAQRAWLSILHKGLECECIEINPYDKTASWMIISRDTGQVPVLEFVSYEGKRSRVIDSLRIMEFVDDYYRGDGPTIYPENPEQIAEVKFWIDFVSNKIIPCFYRFLKAQEAGKLREESQHCMLKGMDFFTQSMSDEGPFFMGSKFGAVDIAFAPFAYRIDRLLTHYRDFEISGKINNWSRYGRWYEAVIAEPSFIKTSSGQQNYEQCLIDFYFPYSLGGEQGRGKGNDKLTSAPG